MSDWRRFCRNDEHPDYYKGPYDDEEEDDDETTEILVGDSLEDVRRTDVKFLNERRG
jgi:hypothetical protein